MPEQPMRTEKEKMLAGKYDAGVTLAEYVDQYPDELRMMERYGEVDTTWVVYGQSRRYKGRLIGHRIPWLFTGEHEPAGTDEAAPRSIELESVGDKHAA